jgi:hypothetical protein
VADDRVIIPYLHFPFEIEQMLDRFEKHLDSPAFAVETEAIAGCAAVGAGAPMVQLSKNRSILD